MRNSNKQEQKLMKSNLKPLHSANHPHYIDDNYILSLKDFILYGAPYSFFIES